MIENNHSFTLGLAVQQERLRHRGPISTSKYTPFISTTCSPSLHQHSSSDDVSADAGQQARSRVNWIKFNILVSIYQNWLRLEPFIRYWLDQRYEKGEKEDHQLWPFLHRKKEQPVSTPKQAMVSQEESDIFLQMRLRRQQLLKGLEPSSADIDNLSQARHLAKQMLSTLAIQNTKWTKVRIEKQNRLFDEMINNFNQEQFQKNSEVIMHSIKERLFFIDQLQKKYLDYSKEQKVMLDRKIEMLKQPFKKVFEKTKGKGDKPEALFESLWQEIECQRTDVLKKKPQLRHTYKANKNKQRYAIIEKSVSGGLVIKYQIKHSDYFNESYLRTKQKSKTKKGKNLTKSSEGGEESMQASIYGELTKDSVEEQMEEKSSIASNQQIDLQQQEINNQYAEDFLRRQKQKQGYRQQPPNFFKKGATKLQSYSHYRPSISYIDGRSEFAGLKSRVSISRERTSVFARRESRRKPTDDEEAEREDQMSRFKSHKKLITLKNIAGNRYTKLRDSSKKSDHSQDTFARISGKLSKLQKKEFRKETLELRKGAHWKKAGNRKDIQENTNEEEGCSISQNNFLLSKQEFLAYFNKVLASGQLNEDRHEQLREKVKVMLRKHEPAAVAQTHNIVQKLVQKSLQHEYSSLMGQGRSKLLLDLYGVVSKDECIRAKIREEMKIFFNEDIEEEAQSDESLGNEQFMYNTTELRKVNQQLKRIVCFKVEGDTLSFANRLVKEANSLQQCQF